MAGNQYDERLDHLKAMLDALSAKIDAVHELANSTAQTLMETLKREIEGVNKAEGRVDAVLVAIALIAVHLARLEPGDEGVNLAAMMARLVNVRAPGSDKEGFRAVMAALPEFARELHLAGIQRALAQAGGGDTRS